MQAEEIINKKMKNSTTQINLEDDENDLSFCPQINEISKSLKAKTYEDYQNWEKSKNDKLRKKREQKDLDYENMFKPKLSEKTQKLDKKN